MHRTTIGHAAEHRCPHPGCRRPDRHPRAAGDEPAQRRLRGLGRGRRARGARALQAAAERPADPRPDDAAHGRPGSLQGTARPGQRRADPDAHGQDHRTRPRARPGAGRRRLPDQAVFAGRAAGAREGAAAPCRPAGRGAGQRAGGGAEGRRRDPQRRAGDLAVQAPGALPRRSDRLHRARVRPAAALRVAPRPRVLARAAAQRGLGLHARRLRTHRHDAHQPAARQARGRPDAARN